MNQPLKKRTSVRNKKPLVAILTGSEQFTLTKTLYFILETLSYDELVETWYFDYQKGQQEKRPLTLGRNQQEELVRLYAVITEEQEGRL